MARIARLPIAVVNQIAAGEVIERPASVVKELLENSLDAGATRIEVSIEEGGRDLIRVWDNGCGISAEELALAVAPHATSKLETADDLFHVGTYGFRGEALASIASVSHLRLQSRPADCEAGASIEVRGSETGETVACGCPQGTLVEIRNLFFNTPVRRRFLKATHTEMGHIVEAFTRIAISHPHLAMALRHNDKVLFDLPPTGQLIERLGLFFGRELAESVLCVESQSDGRRLWGYVSQPAFTRSNARMQYLFVNGRYVRDRSLQHAVTEAYRGLLMVGRFPVTFLFLEIPSDDVDVNVHPTKIEVRFRDPQSHFRQVLATLRQKFLSADLTSSLRPPGYAEDGADGGRVEAAADMQSSLREFFARGGAPTPGDSGTGETLAGGAPGHQFQLSMPPIPQRSLPLPFSGAPAPAVGGQTIQGNAATSVPAPTMGTPQAVHSESSDATPGRVNPITPFTSVPPVSAGTPPAAMQVHDSYIVLETSDGLMLIDQHALHERVLYEELRRRVLDGQLESQRLLVPEIIELSAADVALISDCSDVLGQLGMTVEPFGGTSVALHTYPAMLANLPADQMLRDVVDAVGVGAQTPTRRDLLDSLLHMIACKAAIKAGQRLTPDEIQALVAQQHLTQDSHHCPHGRPTALVFSKADLERQFKRT